MSDDVDLDAVLAEVGPPEGDPRAPPRHARTDHEKLRAQVARCLHALVGASGNLASYTLAGELRVTGRRELPGGLVEHSFEADAIYESEFTVYGEDERVETRAIAGSIVLDASHRLQLDEGGRVRIAPWTTTAALLGIE